MSTTRLSILALIFVFVAALLLYSCNFKQENKETKRVDSAKKDTNVISKNKFPEYDTFIKTSPDFIVNNINCYFKYETVSEDTTKDCKVLIQLINKSTNKVILTNEDDYYSFNLAKYTVIKEDINFDGYTDFRFRSPGNSGSGATYYNVYIFNNLNKNFEESKSLSGSIDKIDTKNKRIIYYTQGGSNINHTKYVYFGNKGKIKFIEEITSEGIKGDTLGRRKITYEKKINNKIVKRKTYISADEY